MSASDRCKHKNDTNLQEVRLSQLSNITSLTGYIQSIELTLISESWALYSLEIHVSMVIPAKTVVLYTVLNLIFQPTGSSKFTSTLAVTPRMV